MSPSNSPLLMEFKKTYFDTESDFGSKTLLEAIGFFPFTGIEIPPNILQEDISSGLAVGTKISDFCAPTPLIRTEPHPHG